MFFGIILFFSKKMGRKFDSSACFIRITHFNYAGLKRSFHNLFNSNMFFLARTSSDDSYLSGR